MLQPLPRGQLPGVVLLVDLGLTSAKPQSELKLPQFVDKRSQVSLSSERPRSAKRHLFTILYQRPELTGVSLEPLGDLPQ